MPGTQGGDAAYYRAIAAPPAEFPLIEQALWLFEQAPPSAEHAQAWLDYAHTFLRSAQGKRTTSCLR
jgi:hypothetical protein